MDICRLYVVKVGYIVVACERVIVDGTNVVSVYGEEGKVGDIEIYCV